MMLNANNFNLICRKLQVVTNTVFKKIRSQSDHSVTTDLYFDNQHVVLKFELILSQSQLFYIKTGSQASNDIFKGKKILIKVYAVFRILRLLKAYIGQQKLPNFMYY